MSKLTVIGSPASPFVRKVLAVLRLKGVEFEIDPIVPFFGDDAFTEISPLRRVPVLIDGDITLTDSSVIAQYLEEKYPSPPMLPASPAARAKHRWLEEYADTYMADIFLWRCFYAVVIKPSVWGAERDLEAFKKTLATEVVDIMNYLESVAPQSGFLDDAIGLGDIAVAVMFRNMRYARWRPDPEKWPLVAKWVERTDAHADIAALNEWADALVQTPVAEQLARARALGLPLTATSRFGAAPRRGPMTTGA